MISGDLASFGCSYSRRLLLHPLGTGLALLPSAKAVDPYTRWDGQWSRCRGAGHFLGQWTPSAPSEPTSRKPGRLIARSRRKPFPSLLGALQAARKPRRQDGSRPAGSPLCVTVTTHSHAGVPPQSSHPPSPRCLLPHPRPPCHRLLHALVHCPQCEPDSQLRRHAARSPHPQGPTPSPDPPNPRAETTFRSRPARVSCGPIAVHYPVVSPNRHWGGGGTAGGPASRRRPCRGEPLGPCWGQPGRALDAASAVWRPQ